MAKEKSFSRGEVKPKSWHLMTPELRALSNGIRDFSSSGGRSAQQRPSMKTQLEAIAQERELEDQL